MYPQPSSAAARPRARLFIYDRHDLARESLHELLQDEGFDVVGTHRDPDAAVAQILDLRPDVCVLDVGMLTGAGVDICRRVREAAPSIRCVLLAAWKAPELDRRAAAAGAYALVLKNVRTAELLAAVDAAAAADPAVDGASVREGAAGGR
ncbi:response regulator [Sinomonas atrocyanea]|uniref:response regulator n=1 Tax=Sinomonas atrocyanea TaxID=37927 RepID=UPI002781B3F4|nr:response regulator [Sinomonas atrocyanea]MDQ0260728.1 DNA-binding NarL/FixJ family response regulator [Sinomonas atrocyanea]MDR6622289.1 DNA-binding NarL/FixJ family response regulator [Sinomonas atrocyanea]